MTSGGGKHSQGESSHGSKHPESRGAPRDRIVDALLSLAARRDFKDVTITDIAREAGVSLADFRDLFPSKGAVLAAFSRKIDREVLDSVVVDYATETPHERLYDVLRRRLKALRPYREGLASIIRWASTDPLAAAALNRQVVNSMRFMLEAADIDSEGAVGALKLQGLALAWRRVMDVFVEDSGHDFGHTLSTLDRELSRGERFVDRAEDFARLASPLTSLAKAVFGRSSRRERREHDLDDDFGDGEWGDRETGAPRHDPHSRA